ncbi:MAG TPA: hypothetical protein VFC79_02135 [Tissierellaceae bacterium]|nr:hypothetical protein [Tissierellaceae bacterium]
MAKLHKLELYITDYSDKYYNADHLMVDIERNLDDVLINCFNKDMVKIDWHDDIDLNYEITDRQVCEKYFD